MTTTDNTTIRDGARALLGRGEHAIQSFVAYVMEQTACTEAEATKVWTLYRKERLIKVDSYMGTWHIKHGLTTNVRCLLYTAAVLLALFAARATFANDAPAPVVNINTATEAELAYLPGVGDALATRIYTYAEAGKDNKGDPECDHRCHFRSIDDLLNVKGIGPKKLAAIRPHVVLSGDTTATAKIRGEK